VTGSPCFESLVVLESAPDGSPAQKRAEQRQKERRQTEKKF